QEAIDPAGFRLGGHVRRVANIRRNEADGENERARPAVRAELFRSRGGLDGSGTRKSSSLLPVALPSLSLLRRHSVSPFVSAKTGRRLNALVRGLARSEVGAIRSPPTHEGGS